MRGILIVNDNPEVMKAVERAVGMYETFGLNMDIVDYTDIAVTTGDEAEGELIVNGERVPMPDLAIVAAVNIGDNYPYQLMAILRMLETRGVVCINPYDAIEKARDKIYSMQLAKQAAPEVLVPRTMLVTPDMTAEDIGGFIGYPMVLKIMHGSQGKGVTLVESPEALGNVLDVVVASEFGDQIIAQQAIMSSHGRDLRVLLAAGKVCHAFVRCNDSSFKSNIHQGGYFEEFDVPDSLKRTSEAIAKAFGLKMCSVDYLFGENEGEFYLCEVNSSPGQGYPGSERIMVESMKTILSDEGLI